MAERRTLGPKETLKSVSSSVSTIGIMAWSSLALTGYRCGLTG
jgi:hypothetical protein